MIGADHLLLAYFATELVACLMPGPAVLSVVGVALTGSIRAVASAIAGINLGNAIWYAMVGAGLLTLVHTAPALFTVLRWAGIAYLFRLGIGTWRRRSGFALAGGRGGIAAEHAFVGGLAVQLSNPKALLFFTLFLPPFIDPRLPVAGQLVTLAMIGIGMEIVVLAGYGLIAARLGRLALSGMADAWIARVSGGILLAIAVAMTVSQTS